MEIYASLKKIRNYLSKVVGGGDQNVVVRMEEGRIRIQDRCVHEMYVDK